MVRVGRTSASATRGLAASKRAPVGQTETHAPQATQPASFISRSNAVATWADAPRPTMANTSQIAISWQACSHRPQPMHLARSIEIRGWRLSIRSGLRPLGLHTLSIRCCSARSLSSHRPRTSPRAAASGYSDQCNSKITRRDVWTRALSVQTRIPSSAGVTHAGKSRGHPSTSTTQSRHLPDGVRWG